jgi:hypothetical protein
VAYCDIFGPGVILILAWCRFGLACDTSTFKAILRSSNATAIGWVGAACVILWELAESNAAGAMVFSIADTGRGVFVQAPICILVGGICGAILHPDAQSQVPCVDQGTVPFRTSSEATIS